MIKKSMPSECHQKALPWPHLFIQCFPSLSPFSYLSFFPACSQVPMLQALDEELSAEDLRFREAVFL